MPILAQASAMEACLTSTRLTRLGRAALCALGLGFGATGAQAETATVFPPGELAGLGFTNADNGRILVAQADSAQLYVVHKNVVEPRRISLGGALNSSQMTR